MAEQTAAMALREAAGRLRGAGIGTATLDARLLLLEALGVSHARLIADPGRPLNAEQARRFDEMVARRLAGEPVTRIIGRTVFCGRAFHVTPAVLDPRPETETLVAAALAAAEAMGGGQLRLVEAGVGCGAVIVSLLAELPAARGIGVDLSSAALRVAGQNARAHGVDGRLSLARGDWLACIAPGVDMVVANPPYIASGEIARLMPEVRDHDPALALDGGADGLAAYRTLAGQAARLLRRGGMALFEVGAGQAAAVAGLLRGAGLGRVRVMDDVAGIERVVAATR
ncbi:MAG TPA: peptide chain release factor N(5)-glutamine methyltransferase [Thermopetrobacter sp.]|nr:peptide chain release factor N(5)-glutamine methyltransferase [Thermopetrobacter sp.]